jgi:P27 family predicted phage terminase small subunit
MPLPKPPKNLTEPQQKAWREALGILQKNGSADRVNLSQLEVYCRAVVRMREAEANVAEFGEIVPAPRTGLPIKNPYLGVAADASKTVAKLSNTLGIEGELTVTEAKPSKPLSVAAYARRLQVKPIAVRKAIAAGRLSESIVRDKHGKPKIADPALADNEWRANTRRRIDEKAIPGVRAAGELAQDVFPIPNPSAVKAEEDGLSYAEARRRRELEQMRQARIKSSIDEIELKRRRGEVIEVAEARAAISAKLIAVKTKVLGLPSSIRQRMPHIVADDVRRIDDLCRRALEELADEL